MNGSEASLGLALTLGLSVGVQYISSLLSSK